jgi:hypothetical protein
VVAKTTLAHIYLWCGFISLSLAKMSITDSQYVAMVLVEKCFTQIGNPFLKKVIYHIFFHKCLIILTVFILP